MILKSFLNLINTNGIFPKIKLAIKHVLFLIEIFDRDNLK